MCRPFYISVILPLKLEWEPCYVVPDGIPLAVIEGNADEAMEGSAEGNTDEAMDGSIESIAKSGSEGNVGNGSGIKYKVETGDRVRVKFAGKEYVGVVSETGITPDIDPKRILPVISVEKELEKIREEEIRLWRQIAEYYLCSIGEVYKAAYPTVKTNLEESRAASLKAARDRRAKIIRSMEERVGRIEARLKVKEEQIADAKDGTKKKINLIDGAERIRKELATAKKALDAAIAATGTRTDTSYDTGTGNNDGTGKDSITGITLSMAQEKALKEIKTGFGQGKPVLLHGVTGSGKTEIYLKLAAEVISKGKNVLYLVPEIALSRQLEERLLEHFGDRLSVFHSGETAVSRRNTAENIRNSRNGYVVLGTRSALFLPHKELGLIIVDEEHDNSYKQDSPAPRYNGRDTALMLSTIHQCCIILGSATPSLEETYNCECGKHILVRLLERYHGSEDSDIEIIDTRAEWKKRGMEGNFSRKLIEHIRKALANGEQVMILRSRRSWAPALQCQECGELVKCPHCNVSMSLHNNGDLICHHCGHRARFSGSCTKCNGTIKPLGAGTQKIEEEAASLFPTARIARLDSDTAQDKKYEKKTIKSFENGEIDILIGTQMLTKGFDFERLSLVAVISADTLLGMQDFRADEKALQLLEQFRGRCGRRGQKGLFAIQTAHPEHPIYQRIADNDINSFSNSLLLERKMYSFPPYSRILEITVRDRYEDRAERMAKALADILKSRFGMRPGAISLPDSPVTGPYTPAVDKIAGQYIRCIRINLRKDRQLKTGKKAVKEIIQTFEKEKRYDNHIVIDVDPA